MALKRFLSLYKDNVKASLGMSNIQTRPGGSLGLWLLPLLPIALLVNTFKHSRECTEAYKLSGIIGFGLLLVTVAQLNQLYQKRPLKVNSRVLICAGILSFLLWICLKRGILFSCFSGFCATIAYAHIQPLFLRTFPHSFSFGEAAVASQAFVLFLFSAIVNIYSVMNSGKPPRSDGDIVTIILQVGTIGVAVIATLPYRFRWLRTPVAFYSLVLVVIFLGIVPVLHIALNGSPVLWLLQFMFENLNRVYILLFWVVCTSVAVLAVHLQVNTGQQASTGVRKVFHVLAVAVFLTGLLYECTLLYVASGIVFALFIAIETLRLLDMPPFGSFLQDGFNIYADEKDAGGVSLTPLYLLGGVALPLWLHPSPCDLTDCAGLQLTPLLSGVLGIGVGDTAASVLGSRYGWHKWPGSMKSVEGTLASIVCQFIFAAALLKLGYVVPTTIIMAKIACGVIINALVEARTDQVDNLALPIITFILLSL